MKSRILLILMITSLWSWGQVPNTATFSLQDVSNEIGKTNLYDCFVFSTKACFNPSYDNDTYAPPLSLLRFRDYNANRAGVSIDEIFPQASGTSFSAMCNIVNINYPTVKVSGRGVVWSIYQNPTTANSKSYEPYGIGYNPNGPYMMQPTHNTANPIVKNTVYYVRAYIEISGGGIIYSGQEMLTTTEILMPPTVSTTSAVNTEPKSNAALKGNVSADGGSAVTARGFCYATTSVPTIANSKTSNGTGLGIIQSVLTGLTPSTNYYVRAYASNSIGISYGNQIMFTTPTPPAAIVGTNPNILQSTTTTCSLFGYIENFDQITVLSYGVCYLESVFGYDPTIGDIKTHVIQGASYYGEGADGFMYFLNSFTGLTEMQTYRARAYVTTTTGTFYGGITIFRLSDLEIGDYFGGGRVVEVIQPGDYGYEHNIQHAWVISGVITGPAGYINMEWADAIAAGQDYTITVGNTTYSDWVTPTRYEVDRIFTLRQLNPSLFSYPNAVYWTISVKQQDLYVYNLQYGTVYTSGGLAHLLVIVQRFE